MKSDSVRVSVVIPTLGRPEILKATIEHLDKIIKAGVEVIVIEQETKHSEGLEKHYSWLRYFWLKEPSTVQAKQLGVEQALGKIILFLDDDVIPSPKLIEEHERAHRVPSVGVVAGRIQENGKSPKFLDPRAHDPVLGYMHTTFDHDEAGPVFTARGCNMSVKRECIFEIGGFDFNLSPPFFFREETDICFRIKKLGYTIQYCPTAHLHHLSAKSGGTRAGRYTRWSRYYLHLRDDLYFAFKHYTGGDLTRCLNWIYSEYVGRPLRPWVYLTNRILWLYAKRSARSLAENMKGNQAKERNCA